MAEIATISDRRPSATFRIRATASAVSVVRVAETGSGLAWAVLYNSLMDVAEGRVKSFDSVADLLNDLNGDDS